MWCRESQMPLRVGSRRSSRCTPWPCRAGHCRDGTRNSTGKGALEIVADHAAGICSDGCGDFCPDSSETNGARSEEHTSELQSQSNLVCRLLLAKKHQRDQLTAIPVRGLLAPLSVAGAIHILKHLIGRPPPRFAHGDALVLGTSLDSGLESVQHG